VIGNSPDTDRHFRLRAQVEQAGVQRHPHRLLHVGRMVAWKRVDLLLEAARRLKDRYPDLDVVVAGEGPMAAEWRQLSESLGQQEYVRFVGGVYEPLEVARLFMESGVYVLAGMGGISINDAMCYGCPVVCSVCDGTERRLVRHGDTGLFFIEGDAGDLTSTLHRLLANPEVQVAMGEAGTQRIRSTVNIYSVLAGYMRAFEAVTRKDLASSRCDIREVAGRAGYDVVGLGAPCCGAGDREGS
jgi:glycosyltransferase involved in cell wall biosynthesis